MCGRFRRRSDKQKVAKTFAVTAGLEETDFEPGDDFSPQSFQPVIYLNDDGERQIELMRWAFKLPDRLLFNARSEDIEHSKFWKDAFAKGRVIVPGDAIFEWKEMTTLTLLLIYLQHQIDDSEQKGQIADLIFSQRYGKRSFNLDIPERTSCMEALYKGKEYHDADGSEAVSNILARYADLEDLFAEDLGGAVLPYFVDWLMENVHLVEITAYSGFHLHGMNGRQIHRLLARMTEYVETNSGFASHYAEYAQRGRKGYEIEHMNRRGLERHNLLHLHKHLPASVRFLRSECLGARIGPRLRHHDGIASSGHRVAAVRRVGLAVPIFR